MVKDYVHRDPSLLLALTDFRQISIAESYLKYSTGIEIECHKGDNYSREVFRDIDGILAVNIDDSEQRYRICGGRKGLIALYELSIALKKHSVLNPGSGIHYHIDCSEVGNWYDFETFVCSNETWILSALKSWNYTGTFNAWAVSPSKTAVRVHDRCNTIEFRIGEMTFDYELLLKRILHCQHIVHKLKLMYSKTGKNTPEPVKPTRRQVYLHNKKRSESNRRRRFRERQLRAHRASMRAARKNAAKLDEL